MAVSTYNAIGTVTLSSAQTQVTFSNIPQIYTDLVVVHSGYGSTLFGSNFNFNGDTLAIYSQTGINGNGTSATSYRDLNNTKVNAVGLFNTTGDMGANVTHIMNYSNSTTFKTVLSRMGSAGWGTRASVSLWRSTAAINSITITSSSTDTYSAGATFSLYGVGANTLKASGGDTIVTDGTYWYHAFKSSGTFTPNSALSCDVLVVGGGAGGGKDSAGGGGAGGVFYATTQSISTAQAVVVGAGGAGATSVSAAGGNGSNSTFGSLTAGVGGGGGSTVLGAPGGSGGGTGRDIGSGTAGGASTQTGTGGTGYGNAGGANIYSGGGGGGGGGSSGAGSAALNTSVGGAGGAGNGTWAVWLNTTSTGVGGYIAGGGGGGSNQVYPAGVGGTGGGGSGGSGALNPGTSGFVNTGSGGGGSSGGSGGVTAGAGGSGLVIVRYAV
jgi:hypothetical protein